MKGKRFERETYTLWVLSRSEAEEAIQCHEIPREAAIISFRDPQYPPLSYDHEPSWILDIPCEDLDEDELGDYGYTKETYFKEAQKAAGLIRKALSEGRPIICQCEHGMSRSAGVAAAILQFTEKEGIEIFMDGRFFPNKTICQKLLYNLAQKAVDGPKKGH